MRGFSLLLTAMQMIATLWGQVATPPSAPSNHGLVLTLSIDQQPEPADSPLLKACLADHPPLACVPLTATLSNEGKETILNWYMSCPGDFAPNFEFQRSEGHWELFPGNGDLPVCTRNVLVLESLSPGEVRTWHLRLADNPYLDTAFPADDGRIHSRYGGFEYLVGRSPHAIRAMLVIDGCATSRDLRGTKDLEPFSAQSLCNDPGKTRNFITLRSNVVNLDPQP